MAEAEIRSLEDIWPVQAELNRADHLVWHQVHSKSQWAAVGALAALVAARHLLPAAGFHRFQEGTVRPYGRFVGHRSNGSYSVRILASACGQMHTTGLWRAQMNC